MANMVIPNEGKTLWLNRLLGLDNADTELRIILYENNVTPTDASVLSDFDPVVFTGGEFITINWADWPDAVIDTNVAVSTLADPPSWTMTAGTPTTAYGWVMWGPTTGKAYAAQKFTTGRAMTVGATETLDPFPLKLKTFA